MKVISTRRIAGIVAGFIGILVSVGHLVLALFDSTPERYHQHDVVVLLGFVLAVAGLVLIGGEKQR